MSQPALSADDEARVIAALVALDWMDFPHALSRQTIGKVLNCSINEATTIWKDLQDRHRIALKSRFDARVDRKPIHSSWKWVKVETP
jgi:hypothetical protein